jgi:4-aminobutyrate aminotransferase-like enzyme
MLFCAIVVCSMVSGTLLAFFHPRSVDVSIAALRYFIKHWDRLLRSAAKVSDYFAERLSQIAFKHNAKIRVEGLAIGLDRDEDYASELHEKPRRRGFPFSYEGGSMLLLLPALNIERYVAERPLDILEGCV